VKRENHFSNLLIHEKATLNQYEIPNRKKVLPVLLSEARSL